jgi:uncharacterized protein YjbI with pentapeptide repeats
MTESFRQRDLTGAQFELVDLTGATFTRARLKDARFNNVDLTGLKIRGANLKNVEIGADVQNLRINTVEVGPLIEAELDRIYPERTKLRPTDGAGFRDAWPVIEELWDATVAWARQLDPDMLHARVDGEWSFIETLRHLVFATDAWVKRVILGDPSPWHPLDLPFDEMPDIPGVPRDRDARPSLDEVLALRADRMSTVARVIASLTDERLESSTEPVDSPGYPESGSYPVRTALRTILDEEWWHCRFAERDLDTLTSRS